MRIVENNLFVTQNIQHKIISQTYTSTKLTNHDDMNVTYI
jgi:hypothetical protein